MGKSDNSSGGIGTTGLLFVLFVALKLTGVIGWSWWWVLSPALIPLGVAVVCGCAYLAIMKWAKKA